MFVFAKLGPNSDYVPQICIGHTIIIGHDPYNMGFLSYWALIIILGYKLQNVALNVSSNIARSIFKIRESNYKYVYTYYIIDPTC